MDNDEEREFGSRNLRTEDECESGMDAALEAEQKRDTPRTDAAEFDPDMGCREEYVVNASFARELERELAEAKTSRPTGAEGEG